MLSFPFSKEQFFAEYFEQQPHIMRGAYSVGQIDWSEVDRALYIGEGSDANIRVHHNGFVDEAKYTETCVEMGVIRKRIIKPVLGEMLADGASVIYNRMESVSLPIRTLCNHVARFTGATTVANGYVSFGDKETFGNHWDTHDVFAVQLIGRKRWLVYEPTHRLPLHGQTSLHHKHECPAVPVIDKILEAGDVLYIPRGWWHTAMPLREETFHVAIGTHPHSVIDYASWVAKNVWPEIESARRAVQIGMAGFETIKQAKEDLTAALFDQSTFDAFLRHQAEAERCTSPFNVARTFRSNFLEDISRHSFVLNSRLARNVLPETNVNGYSVGQHLDNLALVAILAEAGRPMNYRELRDSYPALDGYEMRVTLDDLLRRDIIACSAPSFVTE